MALQSDMITEATVIGPSGEPDASVDAFILFNEKEEAVQPIVEELSARSISTYFWRRDIRPGEAWEETEARQLRAAGTVVTFLGSLGWGPNHLRLAVEAQRLKKRIIPVLIGNPPGTALKQADGMFGRLRYIDLRKQDSAAVTMLVEAIRPGGKGGRFDGIIGRLIDGNEEQRLEALEEAAASTLLDKRALSVRLRDEIQNRFGPEQERRFGSAVRDPKKMPSVRSWMISALIRIDAEHDLSRQLILRHLRPDFEGERNVRF